MFGLEPWHILVLMGFPLVIGGVAFLLVRATSGRSAGSVAYGSVPIATTGTNGLAIASLILGILWLWWIGSVLALVFGYVARAQIRRNGQGGGGLAVAGIVLGWVGVGLLAVVMLAGLALFTGGSSGVVVTH